MKLLPLLRQDPRPNGFALPVLLTTTLMLMLMIMAISSSAILSYNLSSSESFKVNAQLAADAGLDKALMDLTLDSAYTGTGGEVVLYDDGSLKTTYHISILPGASDDRKTIRATGKAYRQGNLLRSTRRYEMDAAAVTTPLSGPSAVVSGVGGLVLNNNAKITGGDVVVNGFITLGNNSQIGLSSTPVANAVNVRVAHSNCPNPVTTAYPRVCAAGENGEPITIGNNAWIYGDVRATNQTNGTRMTNPGLTAGQTVDPVALPDYDRAGQKAAVSQTLAPSHSTIACGSNQTKTWPANVKITGNISLGNNCTVTLSGNTWITGNLSFGNNARIVIANSLGTTRPTIMVDGSGGIVFGNNSQVVPNSNNTGGYFIAYWSADTSCNPDCTNVTGAALANSQNQVRINLSNNGSASHSILYSRWSRVRISNNGALGAVAGQSIELGSNAVINFTTSVPGSSNQVTTWVKRGYMRVY